MLARSVSTGYGLDVDALLRNTPTPLLEEWRALYDLEPWGEARSDFATGTLIGHLAAAQGATPREPIEYMHYLRVPLPPAKPQTEEDLKAVAAGLGAALKRNYPDQYADDG